MIEQMYKVFKAHRNSVDMEGAFIKRAGRGGALVDLVAMK